MDAAAAVEEPHVLAVDDNLLDRMLVEKLLKNSSCKVMYETPNRTEHLVCSGKGSFSVLFEDAAFINDSIVTTAENGQRALEYLGLVDGNQSTSNDNATKVNMIITDYCMPGMTGYELLKKIKESSIMKDVPVVIMSSENVPTRVNKCLEGGAELFMLKPLKCADVKKLRCQLLRNAAVKAS